MLLLEYQSFLIDGFINTLKLSLAIVAGATFFAVTFAFGLSFRSPFLNRPVYFLVEVLRDIPLIVTMLLIYFVMPKIGLSLGPFSSSTLAVSVWGGANGSHAIRAGLLAVPTAQRETATAFGLRGWKGLCLIVLPQAMPIILPPYVGLITAWVQASSLGAIVGVNELFRSGQVLIEQTTLSRGGNPAFLVYGMILVVYFILCWLISRAGRLVERRFNKHHLSGAGDTNSLKSARNTSVLTTPADGRT